MAGSWTVRIDKVEPFTIHGDEYFSLTVEYQGQGLILRAPKHACAATPVAGQTASVSFLMGQVTRVVAASPQAGV